jgi:hypothetical protein
MGPDSHSEDRLRTMFREASTQIHPTRPAPITGGMPSQPRRGARVRVALGLAVCVAAAAAVAVSVNAVGGTAPAGSPGSAVGAGTFVVARPDGVDLISPETGQLLRHLVGPAPVDSDGRRLGEVVGLSATNQVAYVAYELPTPVIEAISLAGGTPQFVAQGMAPAVTGDGTELAYFKLESTGSQERGGSSLGSVVVRDLATGSERTFTTPSGELVVVNTLSWSADDSELSLSGLFLNVDTHGPPAAFTVGVQVLDLGQPVSGTNPRFVGSPAPLAASPWTDGQFLASGSDLAVVSGPSSGCLAVPTTVLSVDPATGATTSIAHFPYHVSGVVFDRAGDLVAYLRTTPPSCPPPTTTTTTTTTVPPTMPLGRVGGSSSLSGSVAINRGGRSQLVLFDQASGTSRVLADNVQEVDLVP